MLNQEATYITFDVVNNTAILSPTSHEFYRAVAVVTTQEPEHTWVYVNTTHDDYLEIYTHNFALNGTPGHLCIEAEVLPGRTTTTPGGMPMSTRDLAHYQTDSTQKEQS